MLVIIFALFSNFSHNSPVSLKHIQIPAHSEEIMEMTLREPENELNIAVGEGARAQISLKCLGNIHSIEVCVGESAFAEISTVGSSGFISQRGRVQAGGRLMWKNLTEGGVEQDLVSEVIGSDALSNIDWRFIVEGSEEQKISACNVFGAKSGKGDIVLRGVAEDHACISCNGMIDIREDGGGTEAYLTEDVLMLDKTAEVDAIPGLEIRTNDVKASHSASVRKITLEDLFYFSARGIAEQEARRMYKEGFLEI